ncbi:unnamed protein product [Rotaria magnacalcarata]|uniref:Uncharacterized protein n=5 Tax=Rotaria magnacalcarata TaxID=392030 RepID=A0A815SJ81_9BILA|nr:unnamed protein product [Rotaria magnacalcarata]
MDHWIASGIEEDVHLGVEKRQTSNNKRNDRRKQASYMSMGDCMNLSTYCNRLDGIFHEVCDNESTVSNSCTSQHVQKALPTSLNYTQLNYEQSDDESDDELYMLDAFDPFVIYNSSEDDEDDEAEVLNTQQQVAWNSERLHFYTNIRLSDACNKLMNLFRDSQVSKFQAGRFLEFFQSVLPTPNSLPRSIDEMTSVLDISNYSNKRIICSLCGSTLDLKIRKCLSCPDSDHRSLILIYDTHFSDILQSILGRLKTDIKQYKDKIINENNDGDYDIPFASTYRDLLKKNSHKNFISLIFHLDGINLCKSTKLKMWLFSTSIIELPPTLRYRRSNMPLISMWIACKEPDIKLWLNESVEMLKLLKNTGILVDGFSAKMDIFYYGVIADCPALKLILNFIGHGGYFCCWFCFVEGYHNSVCKKRQYLFTKSLTMRSTKSFYVQSLEAEQTGTNVYGHLGRCILDSILDISLPVSIICDYVHVTLLRHFKDVVKVISRGLFPSQRKNIDSKLERQSFPHYFRRKMRGIKDFSYIKASELKNLLLYGFLPVFYNVLSSNILGHIALFICAVRLLHKSKKTFGESTGDIADEFFKLYHEHHNFYYSYLENFVLHLHSHYSTSYKLHGSLSYVNTFAQEDLMGSIASNRNGTRYLGDLIMFYYSVDVYLSNFKSSSFSLKDGPFDVMSEDQQFTNNKEILEQHKQYCVSLSHESCIKYYRRCLIDGHVYHSLFYRRRGLSNSYTVEYVNESLNNQICFGEVIIFFKDNYNCYALIKQYKIKQPFSDFFKNSSYYNTLRPTLDSFYFVVSPTEFYSCVNVQHIRNHCVLFHDKEYPYFIVTPISSYEEHD